METIQYILIAIFIVSAIFGYFLISNVPSLLHTPLMSGMNALSGITLLGALVALAVVSTNDIVKMILAGIAVLVSTINIFAGFSVTDRMLEMFGGKKDD
ncbi:MAG: NAD(P) transhydrogenase subunit alpha [Acholeplasma sp.]|nr:NAD(P) transhydrogenase subunit alpha [Acholeplasma sp.]